MENKKFVSAKEMVDYRKRWIYMAHHRVGQNAYQF